MKAWRPTDASLMRTATSARSIVCWRRSPPGQLSCEYGTHVARGALSDGSLNCARVVGEGPRERSRRCWRARRDQMKLGDRVVVGASPLGAARGLIRKAPPRWPRSCVEVEDRWPDASAIVVLLDEAETLVQREPARAVRLNPYLPQPGSVGSSLWRARAS